MSAAHLTVRSSPQATRSGGTGGGGGGGTGGEGGGTIRMECNGGHG